MTASRSATERGIGPLPPKWGQQDAYIIKSSRIPCRISQTIPPAMPKAIYIFQPISNTLFSIATNCQMAPNPSPFARQSPPLALARWRFGAQLPTTLLMWRCVALVIHPSYRDVESTPVFSERYMTVKATPLSTQSQTPCRLPSAKLLIVPSRRLTGSANENEQLLPHFPSP